jgi:formylglycine-generating enzyme required for sulfatase activity
MSHESDHRPGSVALRRLAWQATVAVILGIGARAPADAQPMRDSIPGTLVRFELVRVPGGKVRVPGPTGAREVTVQEFWIGRTEVTWDEYDVFAYRLDLTQEQVAAGVEADARPSRPYGAPDRGFGHAGFPAIGMTLHAATAYADWLSRKTGRRYRVPTEAEWALAAMASGTTPGPNDSDGVAWHAGNAGAASHAVARKRPNALGIHDLAGNVAEWVTTGDSVAVTRGGSFRDDAAQVGAAARARQEPYWNDTDPQIPKSRWWLSDAPFVGFRLVREPD